MQIHLQWLESEKAGALSFACLGRTLMRSHLLNALNDLKYVLFPSQSLKCGGAILIRRAVGKTFAAERNDHVARIGKPRGCLLRTAVFLYPTVVISAAELSIWNRKRWNMSVLH